MREKFHSVNKRRGVSSVIAVALMVAVVVALVGLVSVVVFNFSDSGNNDDSVAGAAVDLTATQDGVQVTLIRSGNAEEFIVNVDGETVGETLTEEGDSTTVAYEGLYSVIGRFGDGSEEVIITKRVEGVLNGLFTVFQDEENGEVEAQLVERYENDDEYTIVTDTSGDDSSGSTTSFSFGGDEDDGRLLSRQDGELLQELPDQVPDKATQVAGIGVPEAGTDDNNPLEVGDKAKLHKMMGSWCEGDDILLVGEDGQTVLDGDEFEFDNNCGGLQTISQFGSGGEITGVKLINRWQQDINYNMFAYQGNVEPPQIGAASGGSVNFDVQVYEQDGSNSIDTDSPIEGAEVVIGNKGGQTDNSGVLSFEGIPKGEEYFVTVNSGGFDGTQAPLKAFDDNGNGELSDLAINDNKINGDGDVSAPNDDGVYNLDTSTNTLQIGLKKFQPSFKTINQDTVSTGSSTTIDYSSTSVDLSSGTQVSISAGTTSANAGGGGGSYDGGSVSSGASFYSGTATTTSQNVQTNAEVVKQGSEYTPEPPNNQISQTESSTTTDETPPRELQVGVLDKSEIPLGQDIELEMSARTYSEQQVEDKFVIYKAQVDSNNDPVNISTVDVTLPPGNDGNPGNTVTESKVITLDGTDGGSKSGNPGSFSAGNEYVIYVGLLSGGQTKEVGTVDVFNDALTSYTVDLSSSTSGLDQDGDGNYDDNSDLSEAIVGDDLKLTFDSVVDADLTSNPNPTVDLYRNGELVNRIKDYSNGQFTYTENLDEAQYIDYHIGIKESTETGLFDTAVVQQVNPSSDTTETNEFSANLTLVDGTNCNNDLTSNNYDCELQIQEDGNTEPVTFEANGTFGDLTRTNVDYELKFGDGDVKGPKAYSSAVDSSNEDYSKEYSSSGTYLVQLTSTFTDGNGNQIQDVSTASVNVIKPTDEVTGRAVGGGDINGGEKFRIDLESQRSTTKETVDVIIESATNNPSGDNVGGSYKVADNFTLRGGVTESIKTSIPEVANNIKGGGITEDKAIAGMTADDSSDVDSGYTASATTGDVPIFVRVESADDSDTTSPLGDQSFVLTPDGQIEANIQADVIVNPAITLSSTDDGNDDLTATFNYYDGSNSDTYEVRRPDGTAVFTFDGSNIGSDDTRTISGTSIDTGEYTIRNTSDNTDVRTVFVNNP